MNRILIIVLLSFLLYDKSNAQTITISGKIEDENSGEYIQDVHIYNSLNNIGTVSNQYGFFSLKLQKKNGVDKIKFSLIGYKSDSIQYNQLKDTSLLILLSPTISDLAEVIIQSTRKNKIGYHYINNDIIKKIPTRGGEPDLLKGIDLQPGVISGNDGTNNLSVRGSNHWQNLILLDEAVVYNPNHALSFLSVFNNDAIKGVDFYKSYIPVNYGGRNASIIDVRMKEGNNRKYVLKGGIGLVASRVSIEGPIIKEKMSFIVSTRYGNPGSILSMLDNTGLFESKQVSFSRTQINYYDLNCKVNFQVTPRNHIYISYYNSKDHFDVSAVISDYAMKWGNNTGTLRLNSIIKESVNLNSTLSYSDYSYKYNHYADGRDYLWSSKIKFWNLKEDISWQINSNISLKSGLQIGLFNTLPGKVEVMNSNSNVVPFSMYSRNNIDAALYLGVNSSFFKNWYLESGIRLPIIISLSDDYMTSKTYIIPEPRIQFSYQGLKRGTLMFAVNIASQNMHLMTNSSVGIPSDIWIPSNDKLEPAVATQMTIGYKKNLLKNKFTFLLEGYYKYTNNIFDFKDNADLFMNNGIDTELEKGYSKSFGVEISLMKEYGRLQGNLSYTFSRARNYIETINKGKSYKPIYDRPHNLKFHLTYNFSDKWNIASIFALRSGINQTMPINSYRYQGVIFYEYGERNNYRGPLFHQLDLMVNYLPLTNKHWKSEWSFGFINIYNRKNVFSIFSGYNEDWIGKSSICKMYLHGILPSITYNFKF